LTREELATLCKVLQDERLSTETMDNRDPTKFDPEFRREPEVLNHRLTLKTSPASRRFDTRPPCRSNGDNPSPKKGILCAIFVAKALAAALCERDRRARP
jgi:hypothetical protein